MKRITPVRLGSVTLSDPFLSRVRAVVLEKMLPYQWKAINDMVDGADKSHAVQNVRIAAGEAEGEFGGMVFQDSDLAKWIEAVGYMLSDHRDEKLLEDARELVRLLEKAQREDGYLNTYFMLKDPEGRFKDLRDAHELYCAGHLIEAAVALYESTGEDKLLRTMERYVDLIGDTFGPEDGKRKGYGGHEEIELALVKLYRATGKQKYLDLASYFIEQRGQKPYYFVEEDAHLHGHHFANNDAFHMRYFQAHAPVREQPDAVGHAVRAMYLYSGMADVAMETGDDTLVTALDRLWESATRRRMYVTGAVGSTDTGEAFTFDYHLPNDTVYAETCAAIGLVFLAHRMMQIRPRGEYGDVLERALYGGVLSGMSQDGTKFFYVNPLEVWPEAVATQEDLRHVKPQRQPWFGCACCPPNLARLIASIGEYLMGLRGDQLYVHLYAGCEALVGESPVHVQANYPWSGDISITFPKGADFSLNLRIPGWCGQYTLSRGGAPIAAAVQDGYAHIEGPFAEGETIALCLDMPAYRVWAHPSVRHDSGKVAILRGPVCYCLEQVDNGEELNRLSLPRDSQLTPSWQPDLLGGVMAIGAKGLRDAGGEDLYGAQPPAPEQTDLTFVPYYAWNNRGAGEMQVWIREAIAPNR